MKLNQEQINKLINKWHEEANATHIVDSDDLIEIGLAEARIQTEKNIYMQVQIDLLKEVAKNEDAS